MLATTRGRSFVFRALVSRATDRPESRGIWHGISLPVKISLPHRPRIPPGRAPPRRACTGMRYAQPLAHCRSRRPVHQRAGTTPGATAAGHDKAASKSRSPPQARGRSKRFRSSSLPPSCGRTDEPSSQEPSRSHASRLKRIQLQLPERWDGPFPLGGASPVLRHDLALVLRNIEADTRKIAKQRAIVARLDAGGHDISEALRKLAHFERVHASTLRAIVGS